jgi:hypothetical protein
MIFPEASIVVVFLCAAQSTEMLGELKSETEKTWGNNKSPLSYIKAHEEA